MIIISDTKNTLVAEIRAYFSVVNNFDLNDNKPQFSTILSQQRLWQQPEFLKVYVYKSIIAS